MKYRAEVDGLRALAVLPVIFFHAGFEWFSGGFIGVDVFFVISGYLITTIIISEMHDNNFSLIHFYERRARRILPALFFVMAACLLFAWAWLTPSELQAFGHSLIAVSTFSSNILFWLESGYFDSATELKPLLHTWSLAVEEQYYILFPIFLLLTWQLGVRWIVMLLVMLFAVSLGTAHWGAYTFPSANFYLLPTRGWELLVGVFAALYLKYNAHPRSIGLNQVLSFIGLSMIVYAIIVFDETTPFPSLYALIPTIGTGLLILSAVPGTIIQTILSLKFIVGIGLISYSAYLWHQPLLAFAKVRLLGEISNSLLFALCVASLLLAWISWQFVEKPFRNRSAVSRRFIFSFALGGILLFSTIGTIFILGSNSKYRVGFSEQLLNSFQRPDLTNCFETPFNHSAEQWGCNLGVKKNNIDFILFGDSHALSLKSVVEKQAKKLGLKIFFTGSSGCLPFLDIYPDRSDQNVNNCNLLNERVYELSKNENVKGIILSARWSYYLLGDYKLEGAQFISNRKEGPFSLNGSIEAFFIGFETTIERYKLINVPIHLISQPPHQKYHPESAYFYESKGIHSVDDLSVNRSEFQQLNEIAIQTFITKQNYINLYDITDFFCDDLKCYIGESDASFYYDSDHLSNHGALKLEETINAIFTLN